MRSDTDRFLDILEAIAAIKEHAESRQRFDEDKLLRVWCLHPIVIIFSTIFPGGAGRAAARTDFAQSRGPLPRDACQKATILMSRLVLSTS